jgi:hypothetical protein
MTNYKRNSRFGGTGLQPQDELTQAGVDSEIDKGVENPLWTFAKQGSDGNEKTPKPTEIKPGLALVIADEQILNTTRIYEVDVIIQGSVKFFRRDAANDEEFYVPSARLSFPVFGTSETEVLESDIVLKKIKALAELLGEQSNLGERIHSQSISNLSKTKFFQDYRNINGMYYSNQEELEALPAQNKIFLQVRYVPSTENINARPIIEVGS